MSRKTIAFRLGVIGLLTVAGQTALLRELSVTLHGGELILLLGLGLWLLGSGLGAIAGRERPAAQDSSGDPAGWIYLLLTILPTLSLLFLRAAPRIAGAVPGAYLSLPRMFLVALAALLPVSFLLGRLFRIAARQWRRHGRGLAHAYGVECAGAVVGGILGTAVLRWGWRNLDLVLICGLAAAAAAVPARGPGAKRLANRLASGAVALLLLLGLVLSGPLDIALTAWQHPDLLAVADTPYGRTTITGSEGRAAVFHDGVLDFATEGAEAEAFTHLALLHHTRPETVLVIGGAAAGVPAEVLEHEPHRIDVVILDQRSLDLARPHLPPRIADALTDQRVRLIRGDPRRFLARNDIPRYDAVLVAMPPPETVAANRFYTREFAELCARHLGPDGLLALRLPPAANLWTPPRLRLAGSVRAALKTSFAQVRMLPGEPAVALASRSPAVPDADLLAARMRMRGLQPRLVGESWLRYRLTNDRVAELDAALDRIDSAINTDARPACTLYAITLWCARFHPALAFFDGLETGFGGLLPWWSAWAAPALLALACLWARRRPRPRRIGLAIAAGFCGMVLESILLLRYQVGSSVLYQDLGLLLTLFMAGMTVGALIAGRGDGGSSSLSSRSSTRSSGTAILLGGGAAGASLLAWRMGAGSGGLLESGAWLFLAGAWTAAVFAAAARTIPGEDNPAVGPIYAADLAGGCAGARLGGLLLVPLLGLPTTALAIAVLALASLPLAFPGR